MLEFVKDAICLSGLTGSKLKCDVISEYYPFWWNITSGGPSADYTYPTAIVELDAATGEVYIKDTGETILGSAGHALELKYNNPNTEKLKVVLVEKDDACYSHLKNVIRRRCSNVKIDIAEGPTALNTSNIYLMNEPLDNALANIGKLQLGNALFFFDPLRSVEYTTIEKVARRRINSFHRTMTELVIFVFTSDWFLGRDDFAGLPTTADSSRWSQEQIETVSQADSLFGNWDWRSQILNSSPIDEREKILIKLYKNGLHTWFRYVLALPFNPKTNQIFHLILCSNYEAGVKRTRDFYSEKTGNPKYSPDNRAAFNSFRAHHPDIFVGLSGVQKPLQWLILWKTITTHEDGICDCMCADFKKNEPNDEVRQRAFEWLESKGYLNRFDIMNAWKSPVKQYRLNWSTIKEKLGVAPPPLLKPLSSVQIGDANAKIRTS